MDNTTQDVAPVEQPTTPESSPAEQTTQPEATAQAETTATETTSGEQMVPYSRFKEVNDKLRAREEAEAKSKQEAELPPQAAEIKEHLKKLGFVSKDDVEQELRQREADAQLSRNLDKLSQDWDGKDGKPKFDRDKVIEFAYERGIADPEAAFKIMKEQEITDWRIAQALTKSKGIKSESSDGSGSAQAGTTNDDLKQAAINGDAQARQTYLKRILYNK